MICHNVRFLLDEKSNFDRCIKRFLMANGTSRPPSLLEGAWDS